MDKFLQIPIAATIKIGPVLALIQQWIHVGQPACQVPRTKLANWHGSMARAPLGFLASMCCFFAGLDMYI